MKIKAIAINTFREAVRNKTFYLLIFFGVLFIMFSKIISLLTIGDTTKVIKDVGLAGIHFFCILIAIFTGINLVYKEIEKKTIYNILSKPISRSSFILGKFLGLGLTLLLALFAMVIIFFLYLLIITGSFDYNILFYFLLLYFELLIITSVSLLFSSFSTPILSSLFTICFFLIGHITWTFNLFEAKITAPFYKVIAHFFFYILPNLNKFNTKNDLVLGTLPPFSQILNSIIYALLYISVIIWCAVLIFNRKELK